ncbi:Xaa-Pro peptidase family protein [Paenibacillus cisolokensis]|uniref:Peptidase M24 n=1 Tax=Paenibacillus cisolokensis TaxID=1658519 RepID=A0ABQ4NDC1_9BACL|nr:Xaa-Pro peptidase family protein [Paenibacillus cisolokensis]GIQ65929.1 peptidase M24 [Paenibacillus cisolokensis]
MTNRVDALRAKLADQGLEAMLVASPYNRRYISGFTGSAGMVLITTQDAWLLTDFRYTVQAKEQASGFAVEETSSPLDTVRRLLTEKGIRSVAFEQAHVTYAEYVKWGQALGGIELTPADSIVESLRMIKDETELAVIRKAAKLADDTFAYILGLLKPGMTEKDIALEMEVYMRSHGATSSSFDTIVASGERSAMPHGVASDRVIRGDEFVKLDFGALLDGYCSDLTRTVVLGKPTQRHRDIYNIVLEAQLTALDGIRPGMTGKEADALARDVIARYGYGDCFGHSLGHGFGMEIHEAPGLSARSDTILIPGMTVTVEPGIYIPGFGGVRIEDDIVITDNGIKILTSSPKEFTILG